MGVGSPAGVLGTPGNWKAFPECSCDRKAHWTSLFWHIQAGKKVDKKGRLVINPRADDLTSKQGVSRIPDRGNTDKSSLWAPENVAGQGT